MDQQQRNYDEDGSWNVDTKIDAESGNAEEQSKEEVAILSTEKASNFSKTATISIVSDVHVAGDTVNRYTRKYYSFVFSLLLSSFSCCRFLEFYFIFQRSSF